MKFRSLLLLRERAKRWPSIVRQRFNRARFSFRRWRQSLPARVMRSGLSVYTKLVVWFVALWLELNRFVPRIGIWLAASIIYDMCRDTNFRHWVENAHEEPERQLSCFVRLLLVLDVPLYARKPPARSLCRVKTSHAPDLRPIVGTDSLSHILEPEIPVYMNTSVPVTAILRAIRHVRKS